MPKFPKDDRSPRPFDMLLNPYRSPFLNPIEASDSPIVGVLDTGFSLQQMNVEFSQITLGRDRVDGDLNPLDPNNADALLHGSALVNIIDSVQTHTTQTDTGQTNDDVPLWLGKTIGSGQWAESLVEFVKTAKVQGHDRAIANLSFDLVKVDEDGTTTPRKRLTKPEMAALRYAQRHNVIVVVAAGNDGSRLGALARTAKQFDNVVTVGSANGMDRASYSNYGKGLNILAPGNLQPIEANTAVENLFGTSTAAATVSGVMANLWRANPDLNYQQVIDIIETTATDLGKAGWDRKTGAGLLNADAALDQAIETKGVDLQHRPMRTKGDIQLKARISKNVLDADEGFIERALGQGNRTALMVAAGRKLAPADGAVKARLEQSGYTVVVRDDDEVKSTDANGKDLVVISESVLSNKVGRTFTNVKVPVLSMDPFLYDDLKMTGTVKGKDFGVTQNTTAVRIDNTRHPLAAGLNDTVTVYRENGAIGWGNPNNNAIEVASVWGEAQSKSTVFGYEQGATMAGGQKAPSRRAGFYLMNADGEGKTLTTSGWKLFDSAINWLTGESANPAPTQTSPSPTPSTPGNSPNNPANSGNSNTGNNTGSNTGNNAGNNTSNSGAGSPSTQPSNSGNSGNAGNASTSGDRALFVAGSTKLSAGDRAVQSRLQSLGYQVTVKDDGAVRASDANGQDVVLISESVEASQVGTTFTRTNTPVINLDPYLHDDLKLTGNRAGQDFGMISGKRKIGVTNKKHPLAAQLPKTAQVYTQSGSLGWGNPNNNAVDIASVKGDRSKSVVFGYEKGATLMDGSKAADQRVGLFLSDRKNEGQALSENGWSLFDAAVDWATSNSPSGSSGQNSPSPTPSNSPAPPTSPTPAPAPVTITPDNNNPPKPDPTPDPTPVDPIMADPQPTPSPEPISTGQPSQNSGKPNGRFQVIGDKIYDPNGREFIAKGVNKFTFDQGSSKQVDLIKNDWKFNTVRLNYFLEGQSGQQLHSNIKSFSENQVVTIVELHDRTGKYWEGNDLARLKSWFKDLAKRYKDNPYVWFNIANEPGGSKSAQQADKWIKQHQEVIKVIRNEVGASNPIVVDAHFWGQDVGEWSTGPVKEAKSSILKYGDQLKQFGGKSYDNIIFSVHMYDQWNFGESKMADYFDRIEAKDHAVIVGEYGQINTTFSTRKATTAMFNVTAPREIGRIAWVWSARDSNDLTTTKNGGGEHINNDNNPTNLSWLGQKVWKDNRRQENLERL